MSNTQYLAQCIPSNDILSEPLLPIINDVAGALGGLFLPLGILMIVVLGALVLVTVTSRTASKFMKAIITIVASIFGVLILMALVVGAWTTMNNTWCPQSPFA